MLPDHPWILKGCEVGSWLIAGYVILNIPGTLLRWVTIRVRYDRVPFSLYVMMARDRLLAHADLARLELLSDNFGEAKKHAGLALEYSSPATQYSADFGSLYFCLAEASAAEFGKFNRHDDEQNALKNYETAREYYDSCDITHVIARRIIEMRESSDE